MRDADGPTTTTTTCLVVFPCKQMDGKCVAVLSDWTVGRGTSGTTALAEKEGMKDGGSVEPCAEFISHFALRLASLKTTSALSTEGPLRRDARWLHGWL